MSEPEELRLRAVRVRFVLYARTDADAEARADLFVRDVRVHEVLDDLDAALRIAQTSPMEEALHAALLILVLVASWVAIVLIVAFLIWP